MNSMIANYNADNFEHVICSIPKKYKKNRYIYKSKWIEQLVIRIDFSTKFHLITYTDTNSVTYNEA